MKLAAKQTRPLTVVEVRRLHAVTTDQSASLQQRVLASHLLMMLYTRSRTSDLAHVHEVSHDASANVSSSGAPDDSDFNEVSQGGQGRRDAKPSFAHPSIVDSSSP